MSATIKSICKAYTHDPLASGGSRTAAERYRMYTDTFMLRAIEISRMALSKTGTEPFGAVVVKDGVVIGEGLNHSKANHDPTSHGEVEAIRDACRRLECVDLSGCELYSSCEPCAICVATMSAAGISKLYYAASLDQAGDALAGLAAAKRHPVDARLLREEAGKPAHERRLPAEQHRGPDALQVLREWTSL